MERDAIASFWEWWPSVASTIAGSFRSGGLSDELVAQVNDRIRAIHPNLDWEFGPGMKSEHHLCLSGKGDPTLRVVAERWRKKAPAADATWEFYASRQAPRDDRSRGLVLGIANHEVALDDFVVAIHEDETHEKLDVKLHHPIFAKLDDQNLKIRIAFIALDNALGEDDVERWLGAVELSEAPLEGAVPLPQLGAKVRAFAEKATGDKWIILRGTKDGAPIFVTINAAIKRIDHLLLDTHVEITLTLASPTPEGLTTKEEAERLNEMEDELTELLGTEAAHLGRETAQGKRVLHYHVMEGGPAASILGRWRARHSGYEIDVAVRPDPLWDVLDRWR